MSHEQGNTGAEEGAFAGEGEGLRRDRGERSPAPDANLAAQGPGSRPAPPAGPLGWRAVAALFAWGFLVLAFSVGGLADVTDYWWLVTAFGFAAPVALVAALRGLGPASGGPRAEPGVGIPAGVKERELLGALEERGELTPTGAAMRTTLTVAEAAAILEDLAQEGHLEARARDGSLSYALKEHDQRALKGDPYRGSPTGADRPDAGPAGPTPERPVEPEAELSEGSPVEPLAEPLSEREREVLGLLASGKTNREIAGELYVAPGTVKAHVANVYRKLEVHNRTEALGRARALGLLDR